MSKLIYETNGHGLYYEENKESEEIVYFSIGTIQIGCEPKTGRVLKIDGYLPLINAEKVDIEEKPFEEGDVFIGDIGKYKYLNPVYFELISNQKNNGYIKGVVYNLFSSEPDAEKYFCDKQPKYDERKGIIQIGTSITTKEELIKVNRNIYCGVDKNHILKCVLIIPDLFIKDSKGE